jgi:hypothetical protein
MVLHRVLGKRMHQYVEPAAVQHQIRHDVLELFGLENDQNISDRMRPDCRVAEASISTRNFSPISAHTRSATARVLLGS